MTYTRQAVFLLACLALHMSTSPAVELPAKTVSSTKQTLEGVAFPTTSAESAAGVMPVDKRYPELDVRRYGAVCDYNTRTERDGQVAVSATNNLPAFKH